MKLNSCRGILAVIAAGVWITNACAQHEHNAQTQSMPKTEMMSIHKAVAVLTPTQGNTASGVVTFTKVDGGVRVSANLMNVPVGDHGFHIHEFGDCSSADGVAAGGHFNPTKMDHAGPTAEKRHVGDLGNVTANAEGKVQLDYVDQHLAFAGPNSILGRGLILHAQPDDLKTQPTGAAGARIACGVIGIAKE
ncbi:superoxide dismutase family protein [candidate division KSB1 bacterium]|nr:superoxide dismutase family protein [candidate division KSB1 bacterium]